MNDIAAQSHTQQQLYWNEIVSLRVASLYICRYRDYLAGWVTALGVIKAIWQQYAFAWGCIIAVSQIADALKDVFPFAKRYKAASQHALTPDALFIDAQLEWDNIFSGRYTDGQISTRLHKLRKLQHEAESSHFPEGLPQRERLFALSQNEALSGLSARYGIK